MGAGGESGIRTHDTAEPYTRIPIWRLRPLGHLSEFSVSLRTRDYPRLVGGSIAYFAK